MLYMAYTYTKTEFILTQFKFNWVFCTLYGNTMENCIERLFFFFLFLDYSKVLFFPQQSCPVIDNGGALLKQQTALMAWA